jgi:hypothetical protein
MIALITDLPMKLSGLAFTLFWRFVREAYSASKTGKL